MTNRRDEAREELSLIEFAKGHILDDESLALVSELRLRGVLNDSEWASVKAYIENALEFLICRAKKPKPPPGSPIVIDPNEDPRNANWLRIAAACDLAKCKLPMWAALWLWWLWTDGAQKSWRVAGRVARQLGFPVLEREGSPAGRPVDFVDPWGYGPCSDREVPASAQFVGGWQLHVFVDELFQGFFVIEDHGQAFLWSITCWSEKDFQNVMKKRGSGHPSWSCDAIKKGCIAGYASGPSLKSSTLLLLKRVLRAIADYERPRPPFVGGLISASEIAELIDEFDKEWERNKSRALEWQNLLQSEIVKVAGALNLNPRPTGHDETSWFADCPQGNHTIMLSLVENRFGCGYCRRNGGASELKQFTAEVKLRRGKK